MSGFAIFLSQSDRRGKIVQDMARALDTRMPIPRPWTIYENKEIIISVREGIADRLLRKTLVQSTGVVVAIDGRLDNREELLAELLVGENGGNWDDKSDVEVLLSAYLRYGPAFLGRLDGDFCLLVYDISAGKLIIARDPLGHRTLYFMEVIDGLACASAIRQFAPFLDSRGKIDPVYVSEYLVARTPGFLEGEHTPFEGLRRLLPGYALTINIETGHATKWRYWDPNNIPMRYKATLDEEVERFYSALALSVKRQLRSDGPVGLAVSGGLDSSTIAVLAKRYSRSDGRLIGFNKVPEKVPLGYDESVWVNSLAKHIDLPIIRVKVSHLEPTQLLLEESQDDLMVFDEPGSPVSLETAEQFAAAVKDHSVRVLLYGFGENLVRPVDELSSNALELYEALRRFDIKAIALMFKKHLRQRRDFLLNPGICCLLLLSFDQFFLSRSRRKRRYRDESDIRSKQLFEACAESECWPGSSLPHSTQEYRYYRAVKPTNEAFGSWFALDRDYEWRFPMRSLPVLRTTLGCPSNILPGRRDREILRFAIEALLPLSIRRRPKITVEGSAHYRCLARVAARLKEDRSGLQIEQRGLVNNYVLRTMMRDVINGKLTGQNIRTLHAAISLEIWLRRHPFIGPVERFNVRS